MLELIKNHLFILSAILAFVLGAVSIFKDVKEGKSDINYWTITILFLLLISAIADIFIKSHDQEESKKAAKETIEVISKRTSDMLSRDSIAIDCQFIKLSRFSDSIDTRIRETESTMLGKFKDATYREDAISKNTKGNLIKSNIVLNRTLAISYPFYPTEIELYYTYNVLDNNYKNGLDSFIANNRYVNWNHNRTKTYNPEYFEGLNFSYHDITSRSCFMSKESIDNDSLISSNDSIIGTLDYMMKSFLYMPKVFIIDGSDTDVHIELHDISPNKNYSDLKYFYSKTTSQVEVSYWYHPSLSRKDNNKELRSLFDCNKGEIRLDFDNYLANEHVESVVLKLFCGEKRDEYRVDLKKHGKIYSEKVSDILNNF